jgi:hypothetical protein
MTNNFRLEKPSEQNLKHLGFEDGLMESNSLRKSKPKISILMMQMNNKMKIKLRRITEVQDTNMKKLPLRKEELLKPIILSLSMAINKNIIKMRFKYHMMRLSIISLREDIFQSRFSINQPTSSLRRTSCTNTKNNLKWRSCMKKMIINSTMYIRTNPTLDRTQTKLEP